MPATPKMKGIAPTRVPPKECKNEKLLEFMKEECRPVRGIFKNYECEGGSAHICQHKYPNQPLFNMVLQDGEEYEIPLWVARYLNGIDVTATARNGKIGSCGYPKYEYQLPEGQSSPIPLIGRYRQRYGFQSMDFLT